MAVPNFIKKIKEDEARKEENSLVDAGMLQKLQDFFCGANGIYLSCVGIEEGVITKAYGHREELEFIHNLVDKDTYMSLLRKLEKTSVENMIEETLEHDWIKMCGVTIRIGDRDQLMWIVIAVLEERVPEDVTVPSFILKTTEDRFYSSVELLEVVTRQLLAARLNEQIAQEAMRESVRAGETIESDLHRSEAMTQIVKMLESDNGFSSVVETILENTCNTLGITCGALIRESSDGLKVELIARYISEGESLLEDGVLEVDKDELPFFNGKPYMISYDSMKPKAFEMLFNKYGAKAAIFHPVEIKDKASMYLCFIETEEDKIWSTADVKFINDVKRIVQSILSKRIAKNSLAGSYASLEAILENVGCGIYVVDPENQSILYMNQRYKQLFAKTIEENKLEEMIFSDPDLKQTYSFKETYSTIEEKWLDVHKTKINWVDGRAVSLCTIYDISDKKKYQKKMEMQANNDFLTGLYNRMRCEQDLERFIRRAEMSGTEGALLYIDLDDFKHINDGLGHQYGDVLLKAISHALLRIEGIKDKCYRMGGDEFIVIVPDAQKETMERICSQIRDIFTNPWFLKGEDYYCTTSMGISLFPTDGTSVEEIIRKADMALFSAKRKGKNCVEYYNDKDEASSVKRLDLEKNMRHATMNECEEFEVYYQPIVDISKPGNPCCGAEALVRWNSESLGFIQPGDFIPLAEYLGLINPIGEYVLREAAKRCKYWNDMGHPSYKVNVNLSVVQLLQNDIVKKIKKVIDETRIDPKHLRLEVTESLAVNDMGRMKKILNDIKALGVGVALDDFGTGYSSLNHIKEMPIDVIKIDKCFIEHVGEDEYSDAFVKLVSELARTIGMTVCVEGVETQKQYEVIKQMDIQLIQGYYFGKPMKLEDFEDKYL